jgi:hypothetical protein
MDDEVIWRHKGPEATTLGKGRWMGYLWQPAQYSVDDL